MSRKKVLTIFSACCFLSLAVLAAINEKPAIMPLEETAQVQIPVTAAGCNLARHNGVMVGWSPQYEDGRGVYAYFDPSVECAPPGYPYEITGIWFALLDPGGYIWPAELDLVVYDIQTGNPCDGPGVELCRFPIVADEETYGYPDGGTFVPPDPCCIERPCYIGLEYTAGAFTSTPSLTFDDDSPVDTCLNWMRDVDGTYYEWIQWHGPGVGHPVFTVIGQTMTEACGGPTCYWEPGDGHKMHYPQIPNDTGWDVMGTAQMVLADDWECSETGWVTDIHFWGGWKNDNIGSIATFWIHIYEDIPAAPPQIPYSQPGEILWEGVFTPGDWETVEIIPGKTEGWWNPQNGARIGNSSQVYYQYSICLDEPYWFWQDSGTVYWLSITTEADDPATTEWGWKSSLNHWNDNAVWTTIGSGDWSEIWEPAETLGGTFYIIIDETGNYVEGFVENAYGDGWYFYPDTDWWNAWFYDHPFDPRRMKAFEMVVDMAMPYSAAPSYLDLAINWSTAEWSLDQPPADSAPPLPGVDEGLYIARSIVYSGDPLNIPAPAFYSDTVFNYNPEWVSVDVQGYNFVLSGILTHECRGPMDLAFVITGQPPMEACCLPDGGCMEMPVEDCIALSGTPLGPGSVCSVERACCLTDGTCDVMDTLCCIEFGGTPTGDLACSGDFNGNGIDDSCEPPWGACCLPDGTCELMYPFDCNAAVGLYKGNYVMCLGDFNSNGINDRCETWLPDDPHKMHFAQTPDPTGWDVNCTAPVILAEDWRCTETGPVTDIHFWGSWKENITGFISTIVLRIYADVPAGVDLPYSHPGDLLWEYSTNDYNVNPMLPETQGWYDPAQEFWVDGDHTNYYQYDVYIPPLLQFQQQEGTIYWLAITVDLADPVGTHFGWKTSLYNWNDNAVHDELPGSLWRELHKPPTLLDSLNLAFVIVGPSQICDCIPGDANNDGSVNVGDAVYIIAYVFKGGPPPVPYRICSGDANCDCQCNVGDAVYVISYVFKGGPPPCDCPTWLSICGPPLRK